MTRPVGPTRRHSHSQTVPPPAPTSRHRHPGATPMASSRRKVDGSSECSSRARAPALNHRVVPGIGRGTHRLLCLQFSAGGRRIARTRRTKPRTAPVVRARGQAKGNGRAGAASRSAYTVQTPPMTPERWQQISQLSTPRWRATWRSEQRFCAMPVATMRSCEARWSRCSPRKVGRGVFWNCHRDWG